MNFIEEHQGLDKNTKTNKYETIFFLYICAKAPDKMKTTVSVFAAFFFISVLSVSCQGDPGDFNTTFSEIEKLMNT